MTTPQPDPQPVQSDNSTRPVDGDQDVAQDANLDYSGLADD